MLPIILFDDNAAHISLLSAQLNQLIAREAVGARVELATTDVDALIAYASAHKGKRLYFMDIELNGKYTGVDIWNKVWETNKEAYVIYVSAHPHHAMACLRSHAFDFLLKPYTPEELKSCLLAAIEDMENKKCELPLAVPVGSRTLLIEQGRIIAITARQSYVEASVITGEVYKWRASLTKLIDSLDGGLFAQINRACLVNIKHVSEVNWDDDTLTCVNGARYSITRRMRGAFKKKMRV